ncbi:nitroreductase/quinone reductase family protein [Rhodococcus sp. O3]|uniref:nitroreductase/quinone reductase family protein n=1 Tax=Rhodococcus sp. O3 TaxID=3404919 RepID=UPI003B6743FC
MSGLHRSVRNFRRQCDDWMHKHVANPVAARLPRQTLLETVGRRSSAVRRTPVGGHIVGNEFWMVSNHGTSSDYVRNLIAEPRVRVRYRGRWHTGTAHLVPDDDVRKRLATMPKFNAMFVRTFGTENTTIRVDLDDR